MKRVLIGVALAAASILAHADGPRSQYDQSIVNQMALDPNEALMNDDGAHEDPNAQMSPTARAFRNGVINGRRMERADNPPPLPSESDWTPPQRIQPQYLPKPVVIPQPPRRAPAIVASVPGAYASVDDDGPHAWVGQYAPPPQPVYAQPQYYEQPPVYVAPPPQPMPNVYVVPRYRPYYPPRYVVQPGWHAGVSVGW